MIQSPTQPNTASAFPAQKPAAKAGAPLTDAEKKLQAGKGDGSYNIKS